MEIRELNIRIGAKIRYVVPVISRDVWRAHSLYVIYDQRMEAMAVEPQTRRPYWILMVFPDAKASGAEV